MESLDEILYDDVEVDEVNDEDLQEEEATGDPPMIGYDISRRYFISEIAEVEDFQQVCDYGTVNIRNPLRTHMFGLDGQATLIFTLRDNSYLVGYGTVSLGNNEESIVLETLRKSLLPYSDISDIVETPVETLVDGQELDASQAALLLERLDEFEIDDVNKILSKIPSSQSQIEIEKSIDDPDPVSADGSEEESKTRESVNNDHDDGDDHDGNYGAYDRNSEGTSNTAVSELTLKRKGGSLDPDKDEALSRTGAMGEYIEPGEGAGRSPSEDSKRPRRNSKDLSSGRASSIPATRGGGSQRPGFGNIGGGPPGGMGIGMGMNNDVFAATMGIDITAMTYEDYLRAYERRCYSIAMERMRIHQQQLAAGGVGMGMGMGMGMGGPNPMGMGMGMGAPRPFFPPSGPMGMGPRGMGMGMGGMQMMVGRNGGPLGPGMGPDFRGEWVGGGMGR